MPHAQTHRCSSQNPGEYPPSPVGHEVRGQRVWLDYVNAFAEETLSDAFGNCVAVLNKGGSPRLMLAGHADEIAMAVNYITDEGFIHVRKMGGVDAAITKAQRVVIHTRNGPVKGVVGNVAPHLMKEEKDAKPPKIHDLFIDIGVSSKKDARELVDIGDPITLATNSSCCGTTGCGPRLRQPHRHLRCRRGPPAAQGVRRETASRGLRGLQRAGRGWTCWVPARSPTP